MNDKNEFHYRYQQANRLVIQKIIKTRGNDLLAKQVEIRNRVRLWVAMANVANACAVINKKRQVIMARVAKAELRDRMARRIQGFVLRKLYHMSLSTRKKL